MGSVLRYLATQALTHWAGRGFPYGTLLVNTLGSAFMGAMFVLLAERAGPEWRALLLAGLLGGFTTFSAFSLDTVLLLERGEVARAMLNVGLSVVFCLLLAWLGFWLMKQILANGS